MKLSRSLETAIQGSGMSGAVLWDTMRRGSDYWRPGKLFLDSAKILPNEYTISYAREDFFYPPQELLQDFMKSDMTFGDYAENYSQYLKVGNIIKIAMASVLVNLAKNQVPIFYCVHPYIPNYACKEEYISDRPYTKRQWLKDLRTEGCHRIVLVEEIVKGFLNHGIPVKVFELEPTAEISHVRCYSSVANFHLQEVQ